MTKKTNTILIIGSGGREHAIAWSLARSPKSPRLLVAPGNPGTEHLATNVDCASNDYDGILSIVREEDVELVVVGPEQPLVDGLADTLRRAGVPVVGPSALAARLEGSKAFAKAFMRRHGIPTAAYRSFTSDQIEEARQYIAEKGSPIVVKASGLAAGKGAIVCRTAEEAGEAIDAMLADAQFGEAGRTVVIEEYMEGEEASIFAFSDGENYVLLPSSQDHKQIGEGDTGPNTGGMGAYAPTPVVTDDLLDDIRTSIIEPTFDGMVTEGYPYRGILYVGLMITRAGPRVVEYNCRLGDPEAQVVLPLLESDPVELFMATAVGNILETNLQLSEGACACVVIASGGYPGSYQKGKSIIGVDEPLPDGRRVFQAGTARSDNGELVTAGGRVLSVSANGATLREALEAAYDSVDSISFEGATYRRDIGHYGLAHLESADQ